MTKETRFFCVVDLMLYKLGLKPKFSPLSTKINKNKV